MLTRAARRQLRRGLPPPLLAEYNRLALPFLCPSVTPSAYRQSVRSSATLKAESSRRPSAQPTANESIPRARRLATAAEPTPYGTYEHIPFELAGSSSQSHLYSQPSSFDTLPRPLSELRNMDVSNPRNLAIPPTSIDPLSRFRPAARASIPGGLAELQQSIYACIQVGRMERAATLIRYMTRSLYAHAPELQDVHLKYVSSLVDALMREPSRDKLVGIQKWIELDMRAQQLPIGHQILSLLIKCTFLTLSGPKMDRTLRRYLAWAEESGAEEMQEMLSSELFSESEWSTLMRMNGRHGEVDAVEDSFGKPEDHTEPAIRHEDGSLEPEITVANDDNLPLPIPLKLDADPLALRETEQKGLGLSSLKASLVSLQSHELRNVHIDDGKDPRVALQERLESDVLDAAIERWREEDARAKYDSIEGQLMSSGLGAHLFRWCGDMTRALKSELDRADELMASTTTANDSKANMDLFLVTPWLRMMDLEKTCAASLMAYMETILHEEVRNQRKTELDPKMQKRYVPLRAVLGDIAKAVLTEARAERLLEANKLEKLTKKSSKERRKIVIRLFKNESKSTKKAIMAGENIDLRNNGSISPELKLRIAAFLLTIMLREALLPVQVQDSKTKKLETQMQPIGKHTMRYLNGKQFGAVEMHAELMSRLKREPPVGMIAKYLPMLAPPRPWTSLDQGAYLTSQTDVVRARGSSGATGQAYLQLADKRGDLRQIYAALDGLSEVGWKINRPIFDVMTRVWNTGKSFAKIAPLEPEMSLPAEPDPSDVVACMRWRRVVRMIENQMSSYHSQRCFQNFQLEVARSFINDEFYCPHNIDFRGRAYPIPPYLNHMGPDYIRALFKFSKGRELGERGLYWLKVHLANTYGFDKAPMDERARFAETHMRDIYDSAEHPLDGQQWWMGSDDAWQTLAACIELRTAMESPDPTKYVSTLPIQQDGSCNGLQHYAALGGDQLGAEQVNLEPRDKPGDVYTGVLDLVKKQIAENVAKGDPRAKMLEGRLTRKCVKQPVMTNVYGVTFIGAKAQVKKQLVNVFSKEEVQNGNVDLNELSGYVAQLIFASLREMFNGAHAIQQWFGQCGLRISRSLTPEQLSRLASKQYGTAPEPLSPARNGTPAKRWLKNTEMDDFRFRSPIVWTTPLGLPVVQPYRESTTRSIETSMQRVRVYINTAAEAVDKRRQLQGFPPNFVHSLDASHMMLTSLRFRELGLTFAAIHDGFWTHAADVDQLNTELRDAFVRMHGEDIVGRLREEFTARYQGSMEWAAVPSKSPAGVRITALYRQLKRPTSKYRRSVITSSVVMEDAVLEQQRQKLLQSDDPAKVEEGQKMVTAASIFEEEQLKEPPADASVPASNIVDELSQDVLDQLEPVTKEAEEQSAVQTQPNEAAPAESADREAKEKTEKKRTVNALIYFWRPLTFPPAPPKGSFDVARVRDSRYFFS